MLLRGTRLERLGCVRPPVSIVLAGQAKEVCADWQSSRGQVMARTMKVGLAPTLRIAKHVPITTQNNLRPRTLTDSLTCQRSHRRCAGRVSTLQEACNGGTVVNTLKGKVALAAQCNHQRALKGRADYQALLAHQ